MNLKAVDDISCKRDNHISLSHIFQGKTSRDDFFKLIGTMCMKFGSPYCLLSQKKICCHNYDSYFTCFTPCRQCDNKKKTEEKRKRKQHFLVISLLYKIRDGFRLVFSQSSACQVHWCEIGTAPSDTVPQASALPWASVEAAKLSYSCRQHHFLNLPLHQWENGAAL